MALGKHFAAVALLTTVVSARAGDLNRVCMGGNVEQLSSAQLQQCKQQVTLVRGAAARLAASNWHFIVVCDENGWQDYAAFSQTPKDVLADAASDSNRAERTTFLRGSRLQTASALEQQVTRARQLATADAEVAALH